MSVEPIEVWFAVPLSAALWVAYLVATRHERAARRRNR